MLPIHDEFPNEKPTPWLALILSTPGAIIVVVTSLALFDAWWKSSQSQDQLFQAAVGQVRAYFVAGAICLAAGIFLLLGRWNPPWALLVISCGVLLWSLPDR